MDITVKQLKIGTRVRIGAYSASSGRAPVPLYWLKASVDGAFITENVVDYIAFDARERRSPVMDYRYYGNPNYEVSNLLQFLNNGEESWFAAAHESDELPEPSNTLGYLRQYGDLPGFLYHFRDYEIASLQGSVELPHVSEICGVNALPLFKKKGIRPHATDNLILAKLGNQGFGETSYIDFWTQDQDTSYDGCKIRIIGRDGNASSAKRPYENSGLRPVIRLGPETKLVVDENGVFALEAFAMEDAAQVFSEEDLCRYLGLVNPA